MDLAHPPFHNEPSRRTLASVSITSTAMVRTLLQPSKSRKKED